MIKRTLSLSSMIAVTTAMIIATTPALQARAARPAGGGAQRHNSANRNHNTNVNRNTNVNANVNKNVNVDVDVHHHGYGYGYHHYHPVARAASTAAVTAAVMGHYYRTLPASCVTVNRGTIIYYHCGTVWYQHVYHGGTVQYLVVTAP